MITKSKWHGVADTFVVACLLGALACFVFGVAAISMWLVASIVLALLAGVVAVLYEDIPLAEDTPRHRPDRSQDVV